MDIFLCCVRGRKQEHAEQEKRHARIMQIYSEAQAQSEPSISARTSRHSAPPAYHDVFYDISTGSTMIVDSKEAQPNNDPQVEPPSRPGSPHTSIFSVPSTRLTDITSTRNEGTVTGSNTYRGDSPRSSLAFDSAPPSYYDGRSLRERSRSPTRDPNDLLRTDDHPVNNSSWLDMFMARRNGDHGNS